jgi:hypothetical protein
VLKVLLLLIAAFRFMREAVDARLLQVCALNALFPEQRPRTMIQMVIEVLSVPKGLVASGTRMMFISPVSHPFIIIGKERISHRARSDARDTRHMPFMPVDVNVIRDRVEHETSRILEGLVTTGDCTA